MAESAAPAPAWEFHLPLAPSDLLRTAGPAQYAVQEVLPPKQLPRQLAGRQAGVGGLTRKVK